MKSLAPIILFVYNRLDHTIQTVNSLKNNFLADKSILYIYSDASKSKTDEESVKSVREYISNINGFKKIIIIKRNLNMGLADSILDGVTNVINRHNKVIVLEDDLITSKYFLTFLNEALIEHIDNKMITSVAGYSFPIEIPNDYDFDVYAFYRCMSWGWSTWKDRWENVDWSMEHVNKSVREHKLKNEFNRGGEDLYPMLVNQQKGRVNSWAIRWCLHHYKTNSACLYPVNSYVKNIGFDGSGVHCGVDVSFNNVLIQQKKINVKFNNQYNAKIVFELQKFIY